MMYREAWVCPVKGEAGGSSGKHLIVARLTELSRQFVRHDSGFSAEELAFPSTRSHQAARLSSSIVLGQVVIWFQLAVIGDANTLSPAVGHLVSRSLVNDGRPCT